MACFSVSSSVCASRIAPRVAPGPADGEKCHVRSARVIHDFPGRDRRHRLCNLRPSDFANSHGGPFEAWLLEQCLAGAGTHSLGALGAMAPEILQEGRLPSSAPAVDAWLAADAPPHDPPAPASSLRRI